METPDFSKKLDGVIQANLWQLKTRKAADWKVFQEKYWSFKADVEHFQRNPDLPRPACWDYAMGIVRDVENQMKGLEQRWDKVTAERRERDSKRRDNTPPAIWSGGRADGNG